MEKKKNVFAKHPRITMTVFVVLVILIIAGGIFVVGTKMLNDNEEAIKKDVETAITNWLEAYENYDAETLTSEVIDLKGGAAWEKCGGDATAFMDAYNSITDEEVESYKREIATDVDKNKYFYETYLDSHTLSLSSIDSIDELEVEGLYKVCTTIEEKWSYGGTSSDDVEEEPTIQTVYFYIYNGKYIGREEVDGSNKIEPTNTEVVETDEETEESTDEEADETTEENEVEE